MQYNQLVKTIRERQSFLCVGLDPDLTKIPKHLHQEKDPIFAFNKVIIDHTRDLCVAYKPNLAFYEAHGLSGWRAFERTVKYIGNKHLIIADAKRGDIGNTSAMYARAFFEKLRCHAITIAPYMGSDSIKPFLDFPKKWTVVLALTSNQGSNDYQLTPQADTPELLFEKVLRTTSAYGSYKNMMYVVGATHPESFRQVRKIVPKHFLLVPGVGAQGGDLEAICAHGMTKDVGLLVNASRSILYADATEQYGVSARLEAQKLQTAMQQILQQ